MTPSTLQATSRFYGEHPAMRLLLHGWGGQAGQMLPLAQPWLRAACARCWWTCPRTAPAGGV